MFNTQLRMSMELQYESEESTSLFVVGAGQSKGSSAGLEV